MPSPICTTEPISRVSIADEKFLICSIRMELISSVGAAIDALPRACQGAPQALETPADAIVDELVADPRDDAANQGGVHSRADNHFVRVAVQIRGQSLSHEALHFSIQWHGSRDVGSDDATPL